MSAFPWILSGFLRLWVEGGVLPMNSVRWGLPKKLEVIQCCIPSKSKLQESCRILSVLGAWKERSFLLL